MITVEDVGHQSFIPHSQTGKLETAHNGLGQGVGQVKGPWHHKISKFCMSNVWMATVVSTVSYTWN